MSLTRQHNKTLRRIVARARAYYQHILSLLLIILSVSSIYGKDLQILLNEALQSEAHSHLLLMPFFAGLLFYLKKDMVKASLTLQKARKETKIRFINEIIGVAVCLIALLLYWYGSHTFYPLEYHMLSLPIFIFGITLILFNLKTLTVLLFPILFLFFVVSPPTEFMYQLGGTMANFNTQTSYTILGTLGLPVNLTTSYGPPTIVLPGSVEFSIDLPCSGIYTLIAFAMFATFLTLITFAPISKKIALFAVGFLIFEILNILRITTIVSIGYWLGEEVAMLIFHTVAGLLLIFTGMTIILIIAEKALRIPLFPRTTKQPPCPQCKSDSTNPQEFCSSCGRFFTTSHINVSHRFWLKLSLLVLSCTLVTLAVHAPTFAITQDSIEVTQGWQESTNLFPPYITDNEDVNYTLKFLYRDEYYEKIAHQDASLMYAYFPPANQKNPVVYVNLGVASSIANLHNWEACLIAWQTAHGRSPLVSVQDSRDIQLLEESSLIARYLVFTGRGGKYPGPNSTQVTLYWYEKATFNTGVTVEQKFARISLIIFTQNSTEYQQLENQLLTFGQKIARYWKPLKTQSLISLGIPAQQLLLVLSIGFVTFTKTAEHLKKLRDRQNNQKIFGRYASAEEKTVLQTIQELTKDKNEMETREIHTSIQEKTGESMKMDRLLDILDHLEDHEFVKRDITSMQNTPRLVWKNQTQRTLPS